MQPHKEQLELDFTLQTRAYLFSNGPQVAFHMHVSRYGLEK